MIGQPLSEIKELRIMTKDRDGKGSCKAFVLWITNAIMQKRQIAFDGRQWWYQVTTRSPFTPVGESEVFPLVKEAMEKFLAERRKCHYCRTGEGSSCDCV